jgi:pimeloyl-ACP methyl ester carboxylesterase
MRRNGWGCQGAVVLAVLAACAGSNSLVGRKAASASVEGDWLGVMSIDRDPFQVHLATRVVSGRLTGTIDLPTMGAFDLRATIATTESKLRVDFLKPTGSWTAGKWNLLCETRQDAGLDCRVDHLGQRVSFTLSKVSLVDPDAMNAQEHSGRFDKPGETVVLARVGSHLLQTNQLLAREYFPCTKDSFTTDGRDKIVFERNPTGEIVAASFGDGKDQVVSARRVPLPYDSRELIFSHGEVSLRGSLRWPHAPGRHSALVLVHGSAPNEGYQAYFEAIADHFVRHGVAVYAFDKRGSGLSTGDWKTATFSDLAGDVLAAVAAVREVPEVDPTRVGVWGISQAGWIIPIAASLSRDIAFAILASAAAVSPAQQELSRVEHEMRADGASCTEIEEALAFLHLYVATATTGKDREGFELALHGAQGKPWARYPAVLQMGGTRDGIDAALRITAEAQDPQSVLRRVRCPVLAIYGALDQMVRVDENRELLEKSLRAGGNSDVTVVTIPGADHALFPSKTGGRKELLVTASTGVVFAPGYLDAMSDWLTNHVVNQKR